MANWSPERAQRFQERAPKCTEASAQIGTEVHSEHASVALRQNVKVSPGLGRLDHTKCVLPSGYRQVDRVIASDLQEHPCVRAAFVGLSSRMQETRPKFETCGDPLDVTDPFSDLLQQTPMGLVHLKVGQNREIVPLL